MDIYTFLALTPILVIVLLLLYFKKPLYIAAPITFGYTLLLSLFIWRQRYGHALGSIAKGLFVAVDISLIIFGAIFFLEFLKEIGALSSIERYLSIISPDKRIQAILLIWFFGSFIEGTAGFGTPAAIVAPLLVGIGFPAVLAVALALIGNTTAVAFGAVGTPIRIGLEGLDVSNVALYAAGINLIAGVFVPVLILVVLVRSMKRPWGDVYSALPFALWAGICFTIPYFLASFLGQEFPSLVGPLIGLAIIVLTTKAGFLVPQKTLTFGTHTRKYLKLSLFHSFFPYVVLIALLILGKFMLPAFPFTIVDGIGHSVNLFNPGLIFIAAVLLSSFAYTISKHTLLDSAERALSILAKPFIAILCIAGFVQIMIHSGTNLSGLPGMIPSLASLIANPALPIVSPFLGIFGAFITGSATVSTLLFASFQTDAAISLGYSVAVILALQIVGSGVGNMIALQNIVAAQATVKLNGKEVEILKKTIVPCIIYGAIVAVLGFLFVLIF